MNDRSCPTLWVVSGVLPYPGDAGQQQRVRWKLDAFRRHFRVVFLTAAPNDERQATREALSAYCDEAVVLPARWRRDPLSWLGHPLAARAYALATGLKPSNYSLGQVELTPERVLDAMGDQQVDLAVFEYWHTWRVARALRKRGIPSVLDMHDLLWQSRRRQLAAVPWLPSALAKFDVARYRRREEAAWREFDLLVSINSEEDAYVGERLPSSRRVLAPMGVDMERWAFGSDPASPPRLAYYGGLGSPHNQRDARHVAESILPRIRDRRPDAELWIVGSRPPQDLQRLAREDPQVHVTGFVDDVQSLLRTMTAVVCPWTGTYGFRSRLIEVMALGVPVVASPDAVDGMHLESGDGIFLCESDEAFAEAALALVERPDFRAEHSRRARLAVKTRYSFDATYGHLARELEQWVAGGATSRGGV